tara:strand:- start:2898 stop:3974 length:1077 start_codon:yes stop_codon:yes gene_type:complete
MLEVRPIVVADGIVVGGNMRLLAMKELGFREVTAIDVTDWTQGQRDEFMIKDNLNFGDWDYDMLANEWEGTDLAEWGMDLWETEVEEMKGLTEEDDIPEAPQEPTTKLGDVWILGEHRVMCGDSTKAEDVEKLMNGKKADMVFADPPYNALKSWKKDEAKGETRLDPSQWFANDNLSWKEFDLFIKNAFSNFDGHSIYICCDYRIYPIIRKHIESTPYDEKHCIVWKKNLWGLGKRYRFQHEFIVYATKPDAPFYGSNSESDVWEVDVLRSDIHKTPKPVELPYKAIKNSSQESDIVQDLFLGSAPTLIACEKTGRICYGMELDPKYCDVIVKRWEDFTGKKAHLEEEDDLMIIAQAH